MIGYTHSHAQSERCEPQEPAPHRLHPAYMRARSRRPNMLCLDLKLAWVEYSVAPSLFEQRQKTETTQPKA